MTDEFAATPRRVLGVPFDLDAVGAAVPALVVLAVGSWRKGGFFRPDIVVLPLLALALLATLIQPGRRLRAAAPAVAAIVLASAWWLGAAACWRHGVDSWRMPATWICGAAGYAVARGLTDRARTALVTGVVAVGFVIAAVGLVLVAAHSADWTWLDERSLRLSGPLTYPSATGLYLIVALLAGTTLEVTDARLRQVLTAVRVVTLLGVVATDSRGAVVGLAVALCFRRVRGELWPAVFPAAVAAPVLLLGQRDGVRPALVLMAVALGVGVGITAGLVPDAAVRRGLRLLAVPVGAAVAWLLLTQHHAVSGLDASWTERGNILRGAVHIFGAHPWLGAGPDPAIPAQTLGGAAGIAYFTHDEPLEVVISVGLVGAAVLLACAATVLRTLWRAAGPTTLAVLAAVITAGLVDFVWHFPALGLLAGLVVGAAGSDRPTPDRNPS